MGTKAPGEYIKNSKCATCKRCGAINLAWAKSAKTGKFYLCTTAPSANDDKRLDGVRYVESWNAHKCGETKNAWADSVRNSYRVEG